MTVREDELFEEVNQWMAEAIRWKKLALHALHDLQLMGIPIERMVGVGMNAEVLAEVEKYERGMGSFS